MASTIQIDRLLETTVRRNASDLHLATGKPPTLRLHGHLRELQTKVLDPEDTMALMKSITPERIQQEFEETVDLDRACHGCPTSELFSPKSIVRRRSEQDTKPFLRTRDNAFHLRDLHDFLGRRCAIQHFQPTVL